MLAATLVGGCTPAHSLEGRNDSEVAVVVRLYYGLHVAEPISATLEPASEAGGAAVDLGTFSSECIDGRIAVETAEGVPLESWDTELCPAWLVVIHPDLAVTYEPSGWVTHLSGARPDMTAGPGDDGSGA